MSKFKNFAKEQLLLCNTSWMLEYKGAKNEKIRPYGGGSFVAETGRGWEEYNFLSKKGRYYGYVQPPGGGGWDANIGALDRLGAEKDASEVSEITVIWTAPHPQYGGRVVVGWYKNATVRRKFTKELKRMDTSVADGKLLSPEERTLNVPSEIVSQSNIRYGDIIDDKFLHKLDKFMDSFNRSNLPPRKGKTKFPARLPNLEERQKVEKAAIRAVGDYYDNEGYDVKSVERDNVGWDLEARKGAKKLLVEVKGHKGSRIACELTPNEFEQACNRENYRLAVVTDALAVKLVHVFGFNKDRKVWWRIYGKGVSEIKNQEVIAARICE